MLKALYFVVKYIRLAGKFISIILIIGLIYLFGFDQWDSFTYLLEHNSNNLVLLLFCLFSSLMYLRGEYMEVYLERKNQNY
jgi:hypothetical protein